MLQSLSIRNFALIDRLDLELGSGLNVLTGETGAGKSIILGALTTLLGGRADTAMVRADTDRASIDAVFDLSASPDLQNVLQEAGFETEDDLLILNREVQTGGKSSVRISGRPATVSQLRAIGEWLVDLHGQHEHQSLLNVARHIEFLDAWGGQEVQEMVAEVGSAHHDLQALRREQEELLADERDRARTLELLEFQVREIRNAAPEPYEDEELENEARRLANAERLVIAANGMAEALHGEPGALDCMRAATKPLEDGAEIDERLQAPLDAVREAQTLLEEAARDLSRYAERVEIDPERQAEVEERIDLLRTLKRKYGETINEVITFVEEAEQRLERLQSSEQRGRDLGAAIEKAYSQLNKLCNGLTTKRKALAQEFGQEVQRELQELAMERSRFEVSVIPTEPGPRGADSVEFLIAPNPGEPMKPLARIASGGELSRVMLAMKSALARQEALPTMVFDEIDTGIGGRTAGFIADRLASLATSSQIICITHLPQIASRGDQHYLIEKTMERDRTVTRVRKLSTEERIDEIARMLGGASITETVLTHAREMLGVG
jgi:DNA repair protein RecN (Recombination protein N)